MEFNAALDAAINASHRRNLVLGVAIGVFVPGVLLVLWFGVGGWNLLLLLQILIPLFMLTVGALFTLWRRRAKTADLLSKLRGASMGWWLPSPTRGLVLLTDTHVLAGGAPAAMFDRHADCRLTSMSYDESAHALTLDVTEVHRSKENENQTESQSRWVVPLPASVDGERAHAFAREARDRNQR